MAIETQVIPIHFGQGVDTKTDPKLVVAGKMLRLQDAVFTKANQVTKRNGNLKLSRAIIGGGTLTDIRLVKSLKDDLVCSAISSLPGNSGRRLYSYSPSVQAWADRGPAQSVGLTFSSISSAGVSQIFPSAAIAGDYTIYCWHQRFYPFSRFGGMVAIRDSVTGAALAPDGQFITPSTSARSACPKACTLGTTAQVPAAFGIDTGPSLVVTLFGISQSGITYNPVTVATDVVRYITDPGPAVDGRNFPFWSVQYDCATTATGAVVAYSSGATFTGTPTDVKVKTVDTNGAVTHSATISTSGYASPITLNVDPTTGNIWVYWVDSTASPFSVYYAVLSPTLSVIQAKTTIATGISNNVSQIAAIRLTPTTQAVFYSIDQLVGDDSYDIMKVVVSSTGSVSSAVTYMRGVDIAAKPFTQDGHSYLPVIYRTEPQSQIIVTQIDGAPAGNAIARALYGRAHSEFMVPSQIPTCLNLSATQVAIPLAYAITERTFQGQKFQATGSSFSILDFDATDAHQALVANNTTLILNGGVPMVYDGQITAELGFLITPEIVSIEAVAEAGGGATMAAGVYTYYAVLQWTDAQGNLYESAPSVGVPVTVPAVGSGLHIQVNGTIKCPVLSSQRSVVLYLYRSAASGAGGFNRLVPVRVNVDSTTLSYDFQDVSDDASLAGSTELYTDGGVVENIAPPASLAMTIHKNRVWMIDSENPNTLWYSKTLLPTVGVGFSDLFQAQVDYVNGKCVAIASMDDKLAILAERSPLVLYGDGANDTGTGSTLAPPQPIPSDTGCLTSKGVQTFPMGVLFKSPKGIYLLDRSLTVKYWANQVEAYNGQDVTSSALIADKSQIRLLTSSGLTLVYDYIFNQWSTFTGHQGYSADIWRGLYTFASVDGYVYQENPGSYLDDTNPFGLLAQTAWLALAGVQGFQRVRRFNMLGDFSNGSSATHKVRVSAAYDFKPTFSAPIPYDLGLAAAQGVFQYRERLPIQKCDSISLLIEEIPTGDSAESISLTDMSFEAGVKRGTNRLPSGSSV